MIDVHPDVFGPVPNVYERSHESVVVEADDKDMESVVKAVDRAGNRFMVVTENGLEIGMDDMPAEEYEEGIEYTPNTFIVKRRESHVLMYVDCKSQIPDLMRKKFITILTEELSKATDEATVRVPTEAELG